MSVLAKVWRVGLVAVTAVALLPVTTSFVAGPSVEAAPQTGLFSWLDTDQGTIEEYFPDGVVDTEATVNGCGSQGPDAVDVPDDWFGYSFTPACDWHDRCYGTKGLTQDYCDRGMLARTTVTCDGDERCLGVAYAYYLGVDARGGPSFDAGQRAAEERDGCDDARTYGDPHVETFDGAQISFQAAGEFVMVADRDGTLVQARTYPVSESFSVLTGVAARVGEQIVGVETDPNTKLASVHIDGQPLDGWIAALDGGLVFRTDRPSTAGQVTIWRDGEFQVDVLLYGTSIDVTVRLFAGAQRPVSGMLGDADGDPGNDALDADGEPLPVEPIFLEYLPDRAFVEALRIGRDESWFRSDHGFDYHAADIADHPLVPTSAAALDTADLEAARATCAARGLPDFLVSSCVFDVVFGGTDAYAERSAVSYAHATAIHSTHADVGGGDGGDDVPVPTPGPSNPEIVEAAGEGDVARVQELLDAGVDPDSIDADNGVSALDIASLNGDTTMVALLLGAGADPDGTPGGGVPLGLAVSSGSLEVVSLLLDAGADPNNVPDAGEQVLSHPVAVAAGVAAATGSPDVLVALLDAGGDPNGGAAAGDDSITTPLDTAATMGDLSIVRLLLDAGARTDRGLISTMSPEIAAMLFSAEIAELLGL